MSKRSAARTKESIQEYIKRTVDAAPPLTAEQRARIAAVLTHGEASGGAVGGAPETAAARALREERQRQEAEARERRQAAQRLARDLTSCDICGVPQAGHMPASAAHHGWEPTDPRKVAARFLSGDAPGPAAQ